MDFMNLNQSAHGDREFAFIATRMGLVRKTVVGHWTEPGVRERIGAWARAACGWREAQRLTVARFGDNMRQVAVTEGDKVEAQLRLGVTGQRLRRRRPRRGGRCRRRTSRSIASSASTRPPTTSFPSFARAASGATSLRDAARIEAGLRALPRAARRPGVHRHVRGPARPAAASRDRRPAADGRRLRLRRRGRLEDGRARARDEGDGRGAARRHVVHGGLHLPPRSRRAADPRRAHARGLPVDRRRDDPSCEIHPLSIGGREDPVRLVFTAPPGPALIVGDPRPRRPLPPDRQRGRRRRPRRGRCRGCRSRGRSGSRSPTSPPRPRRG